MKELFIPVSNNPLLAELTTRFQNTLVLFDTLTQLLVELKSRRGERIGNDNRDLNDQLTCRRERAYEVAALRVEHSTTSLFGETRGLHKAIEAVNAAVAVDDYAKIGFGAQTAIAQSNVVCALELVDAACALMHDVKNKQLRNGLHYFAIGRIYKAALTNTDDPREWLVMASGHGSRTRFNEGDGSQVPEGPYLTLAEAKEEAHRWCSYADTIGGGAELYNVRTKETVGRWY